MPTIDADNELYQCEFCSVLLKSYRDRNRPKLDHLWICPECGTVENHGKSKDGDDKALGDVYPPDQSGSSNNGEPWIAVIKDPADADIKRNTNIVTNEKALPPDPEGLVDNRLGVDMGRRAGVQTFHEETYYPNINWVVTTDINLTDSAGKNRTTVRRI